MAGMIHLEALAAPDGRVQVYLSDVWRRPLPLVNVNGSVTLRVAGQPVTLPLVVRDDRLEATGPSVAGTAVNARVELVHDGQSVEMNFQLPLTAGAVGAPGVPAAGCVPLTAPSDGPRLPRCTMTFARAITAAASTPDNATVLVAAVDVGVSGWRLPAGQLGVAFVASPPITGPVEEAPHPESVNAVAVSSDGRDAVVAIESRLLRYTIRDGQLVRELPAPGGVVRAVVWTRTGDALLLTAFYDRAAHLISADDGHELARFPVEREAATVATAPDGRTVAVGSEAGPIVLFEQATGAVLRKLSGARGPARALAIAGTRVLAVGDDGVLRAWDVGTGELAYATPPGKALARLGVSGDGQRVATAGLDGTIRVYAVATGALLEQLQWHQSQVLGLAWAGAMLVSGDTAGQVALWEMASYGGSQPTAN